MERTWRVANKRSDQRRVQSLADDLTHDADINPFTCKRESYKAHYLQHGKGVSEWVLRPSGIKECDTTAIVCNACGETHWSPQLFETGDPCDIECSCGCTLRGDEAAYA